jgi:hypothetical protein
VSSDGQETATSEPADDTEHPTEAAADARPGADTEADADTTSGGRRLRSFLAGHAEIVVVTLGIIFSGVGAVAGGAHVDWYWLSALGAVLTAIGAFITRAIERPEAGAKIFSLSIGLSLSLLLLLSIFLYHTYLDPATDAPEPVELLVVVPSDVPVIYPQGQPGGRDQFAYPPLTNGSHVYVDCQLTASDGTRWYRLTENHSFVPSETLRAVDGLTRGSVPRC